MGICHGECKYVLEIFNGDIQEWNIYTYIYNNYIHTQTTNNNVIIMGQNCDSNHKIL